MPGRSPRHVPALWRRQMGWWCAISLMIVGSGCASMRSLAMRPSDSPFGRRTPCALTEASTVDEVVGHVNRNVAKIDSWRASSVKIRAQSVPIPLSGNLVVAREQKLRLEVTSLAGKEVDFGSNDDLFWLWTRPRGPSPPAVYYAAHEDIDIARQHLPLPFEPTWLMEALCVKPLSTENVQLERQPGVASVKLVSQHVMPDGRPIKKVVVVHGCHGYVMEHCLYDDQGQTIVRALLQDYRLDEQTGAILPRHVKLDWPQAEMSLAMDLPHIDVNPAAIPVAVWQPPQVPGTPMVNVGDPRLGGGQQYASRRPRPQAEQAAMQQPQVANGPQPTVVASGAEQLDPEFVPPSVPQIQRAKVQDEPAFEQPKVRWEEPEFDEPIEEEPAGRARFSSLPETDAF